jgi:hypothetical protein
MRNHFFEMVEELLYLTREDLLIQANGLTLNELDKGLNATREYKYQEGQEFVLRTLIRLSKSNQREQGLETMLKQQGIKYKAFQEAGLLKDKQWQGYISGVLETLELVSDNYHVGKVFEH